MDTSCKICSFGRWDVWGRRRRRLGGGRGRVNARRKMMAQNVRMNGRRWMMKNESSGWSSGKRLERWGRAVGRCDEDLGVLNLGMGRGGGSFGMIRLGVETMYQFLRIWLNLVMIHQVHRDSPGYSHTKFLYETTWVWLCQRIGSTTPSWFLYTQISSTCWSCSGGAVVKKGAAV